MLCCMLGLVCQAGIKPVPPALRTQSINHWNIGRVLPPPFSSLKSKETLCQFPGQSSTQDFGHIPLSHYFLPLP